MYAVVGIPGSRYHTWRHFQRTERQAIEQWLSETTCQLREANPALGSLPCSRLSDRAAARVRYRDGKRVYHDWWCENAAQDFYAQVGREAEAELNRQHAEGRY